MIIRTSKAGVPSFSLLKDMVRENGGIQLYFTPYFTWRTSLKEALERKYSGVSYGVIDDFSGKLYFNESKAILKQGKTQRGKLYIQIGCKRFVGVNRRKLIAWAKAA
jgi:hypothetical protein